MKFFKPSDIVTVRCAVTHVTKTGSAFGTDVDEESVYIPVRLVEQSRIDIGDELTCYCIDQSLEENRQELSGTARYRAVRMKIEQRFNDILPGHAASDALVGSTVAPQVVKVKDVTLEDARTAINDMFSKRRAWTLAQMNAELRASFPGMNLSVEMEHRVDAWIKKMHEIGTLCSCVVSRSSTDDAPMTWYAASHDTFMRLIDDYELEDE